jgi:hypothetical protein
MDATGPNVITDMFGLSAVELHSRALWASCASLMGLPSIGLMCRLVICVLSAHVRLVIMLSAYVTQSSWNGVRGVCELNLPFRSFEVSALLIIIK